MTQIGFETRKRKKARNNIIKLVVVILVLVVAAVIVNVGGCARHEVREIYKNESNYNYQIKSVGNDILAVNYDGAKLISVNGEEKGTIENHTSNPHVDICGNYVLMYDKGGNTVSLYNGEKKNFTYECDQVVKKAKVNKNGYVVIVSDEVGYNSRISVLSNKGIVQYIWKIGDVYIIDADISPDSRRVAVAAISTDTGVIVENIIFADINKEEEISRVKNEGSMPLYVSYTDSGSSVVVSDDRLCGYNSSGEQKWDVSYENRLLNSFEVDQKGNTVLALAGIKNNTVLEMYTKNGHKSGEYVTETKVKSLHLKDKYIAVCEPAQVSVINYSGRLLENIDTQKEYTDILITDRRNVILMSTGGIERLSF